MEELVKQFGELAPVVLQQFIAQQIAGMWISGVMGVALGALCGLGIWLGRNGEVKFGCGMIGGVGFVMSTIVFVACAMDYAWPVYGCLRSLMP